LAAAVALHLSPLVTQIKGRRPKPPAPPPSAAPTLIPVDLEPPAPEPPKPPEPPKSPEPKAPDPPKPVAPPPPEQTPSSTREAGKTQKGETKLARDEDGILPRKQRRSKGAKKRNDSPFGGKGGTFRANLCFVEPGTKSVLASEGCEPVLSFYSDELDVSPRRFQRGFPGVRRRTEWFALHYEGRFEVTSTGYYTFRLLSDDGAVLYIDGALAIDNDGQHEPRSEKMALPLNAGEHEFRVLYYQGPGDTLALQLFVQPPGQPEQLFGPVVGKVKKPPR
jgi:hypothetical protein